MSCVAELRGLGAVAHALHERGGRILAISVDSPADLRALASDEALDVTLLSDANGEAIRAYGVVHAGAGPGGATIAIPAQFLIERDGTIVWRHVARLIQDRVDPVETLAAVQRL